MMSFEIVNETYIDILKDENPIKIVYEGEFKLEEDENGKLKFSRQIKLSEIAELFGVSVKDVLEGKIGYYVLEN